MLLVAMLALGTATFAWFTTKTGTTASGIKVKTSAQSSLVVSSLRSEWKDDLSYATDTAETAALSGVNWADQTLKPASSYDGKKWFKAVADNTNSYAASKGEEFTSELKTATGAQNVFYNMLNVKNAGAAATKAHVTIEASLAETATNTEANYLRMAIVPAKTSEGSAIHYNDKDSASDSRNNAVATVASGKTFGDYQFSVTADDVAKKPPTAVAAGTAPTAFTFGANDIVAKRGDTVKIDLGQLAKGEAKYYMLIIWFEGQDADCKDANSGNFMPSDLTFTIRDVDTLPSGTWWTPDNFS